MRFSIAPRERLRQHRCGGILSSTRSSQGGRSRRGLTLIELLVVIIIMSMLVATVIPTMVSTIDSRRIREAARMVSAYLSAARSRAIKTGRPVGVIIQRMENQRGAAMVLAVSKEALPFSGATEDSMAYVSRSAGPTGGYETFQAEFNRGLPPDMVRVGDRIQFNHQGHFYEITGPGEPVAGSSARVV
ncbi:MAG: Tfp pilus assembly protein FimT/FimU, partial [Pirellulales bacterium]